MEKSSQTQFDRGPENAASCLLCGQNHWRLLGELTAISRSPFSGSVMQCGHCGLARFSPLPTEEALQSYYSGADYRRGFDEAGVSMVTESAAAQQDLQQRLSKLEQLLGSTGRLLDVGADTGTFLALARSLGWDVAGLELGEAAIATARARHGLSLNCATIESAAYADESFDVVHASHVLEHVRDPLSFLRSAHRLLRPGGILCLEVPHELGDLFSDFQKVFFRRSREPYLVPSPHLYFFSPTTLCRLVIQSGFQLESCTTPRRNCSNESRLLLGRFFKRCLYRLEARLKKGPLIEVFARKPLAARQ